MANWVTHIVIAERLSVLFPFLNARGLCLGSIAPDCNVENESWTAFTPPREATHFMTGKSKLTADYEGFFRAYIEKRTDRRSEAYAYRIGYFAHLLTDAAFQRMQRDEKRTEAMIARIVNYPPYAQRIGANEVTYDSLKAIFPAQLRMNDWIRTEHDDVARHPDGMYRRILLRTQDFEDDLGLLPRGAIVRKIGVMGTPREPLADAPTGLFFSDEEISGFYDHTTQEIAAYLNQKGI